MKLKKMLPIIDSVIWNLNAEFRVIILEFVVYLKNYNKSLFKQKTLIHIVKVIEWY